MREVGGPAVKSRWDRAAQGWEFGQDRACDRFEVMRKGSLRDALAITPQTAARLRACPDTPAPTGRR